MTIDYDISSLQFCTSAVLNYRTNAASTLSLTTLQKQSWKRWDRIHLYNSGALVFSGTLVNPPLCSFTAGQSPTYNYEFFDDIYFLETIPFCKESSSGKPAFSLSPFSTTTAPLRDIIGAAVEWARKSGKLEAEAAITSGEYVPCPQNASGASCLDIVLEALRWVPRVALCIDYSTGSALLTCKEASTEAKTIDFVDDKITQASFQVREDAVPPICALVGGAHATWPINNNHVAQPGAFIYAVPTNANSSATYPTDEPTVAAALAVGNRQDSKKAIVKGFKIPAGSKTSGASTTPGSGSLAAALPFIKKFWPELQAFTEKNTSRIQVGQPLVRTIAATEYFDDTTETSSDDDVKTPANYSASVETWGSGSSSSTLDAVYVLTEGSFPASSRASRNLRGLLWCKAKIEIPFYASSGAEGARDVLQSTAWVGNKQMFYSLLTLDCILVNKRLKIYDSSTNQLCSGDEDYVKPDADMLPEVDESSDPQAVDYKLAMEAYYNSTRTPVLEGSFTSLNINEYLPPKLNMFKPVSVNCNEAESKYGFIKSVSLNIGERQASVSFGSIPILGMADILERRMLNRNTWRDRAAKDTIPFDSQDGTYDEQEQKKKESNMTVSASISASAAAFTAPSRHKPWTLYVNEQGVLTLAGGRLKRPGSTQVFEVEDTTSQIKYGEQTGEVWEPYKPVKLRWGLKNGTLTYSIYQ